MGIAICPKCRAKVRVDGICLEDFEVCHHCAHAGESSRCLDCTYDEGGDVADRCGECAHEAALESYYGDSGPTLAERHRMGVDRGPK